MAVSTARKENPGLFPRLPLLGRWAGLRGWDFVYAWLHRISGLLLLAYLCLHILTLRGLAHPQGYDQSMAIFRVPLFLFLEWALALPVVFHAFNGGRLMLYEMFGFSGGAPARRRLWWLVGLFMLLLALVMAAGGQSVSPLFFWLVALCPALVAALGLAQVLSRPGHGLSWRLQRISGAFLLVMLPAHFLFMHLGPEVAKEAAVVNARLKSTFISLLDLAILVAALWHGAYGLVSFLRDRLAPGPWRTWLTAGVWLATLVLFGAGLGPLGGR